MAAATPPSTPDYKLNYDDERLTSLDTEEATAKENDKALFDGMIKDSDSYYNAQINATKEWEKTQTDLANQNTEFTVDKIEQQKDQAEKDYKKEQTGAYTDWQKQSNAYGVNAEQMASSGLSNTGYSESSKVSMYNTYQNRVASARESYSKAVLNYDNAINEARLQNSSVLAEIAYQSLQQQLALSLEGFQYKNTLLMEQANRQMEIDDRYYNRYQDVLAQMNQENALAEEVRQFNESMLEEQRQFDATQTGASFTDSDEEEKEEKENNSTYEETVETLKENDGNTTLLKTPEEWAEAKANGKYADYDSYEDYVKDYVEAETPKTTTTPFAESQINGNGNLADRNKDTTNEAIDKLGLFPNGQPKEIKGYGEVTNTGDTVSVQKKNSDGTYEVVKLDLWKTPDGTLWFWNGSKYVKPQIEENKKSGASKTSVWNTVGDWFKTVGW